MDEQDPIAQFVADAPAAPQQEPDPLHQFVLESNDPVMAGVQRRQHRELQSAVERHAGEGESPLGYGLRRSVPFVSGLVNVGEANEYQQATRRFREGQATDQDYESIAAYERLQQNNAERGIGGQILSGLSSLPAVVGETTLLGGPTRAASFLGRAGQFVAMRAGTTPFAPSLYVEPWIQRNLAAGRDPLDREGLAPAMAIGALQNIVLGTLGGVGNRITGNTVAQFLKRTAARTGTGLAEQQGIDLLTGAVTDALGGAQGMRTSYGIIPDLLTGHAGEALQHLVVQATTFAAFAALHDVQHGAPRARRIMERVTEAINEPAKKGLSPDAAAQEAAPKVQEILKDVLPPEPAFHITNYKDPARSAQTALDILARKGTPPRPLEVWSGEGVRERFNGQMISEGHTAFEFNRNDFTGEQTHAPMQGRMTSTDPLRYNPGLKRVIYRGKESDPAFGKLKDMIREINSERGDAGLMREAGHSGKLEPVELSLHKPERAQTSTWEADTLSALQAIGNKKNEAKALVDEAKARGMQFGSAEEAVRAITRAQARRKQGLDPWTPEQAPKPVEAKPEATEAKPTSDLDTITEALGQGPAVKEVPVKPTLAERMRQKGKEAAAATATEAQPTQAPRKARDLKELSADKFEKAGVTPFEREAYLAWHGNEGSYRKLEQHEGILREWKKLHPDSDNPSYKTIQNAANRAHDKLGNKGTLAGSMKAEGRAQMIADGLLTNGAEFHNDDATINAARAHQDHVERLSGSLDELIGRLERGEIDHAEFDREAAKIGEQFEAAHGKPKQQPQALPESGAEPSPVRPGGAGELPTGPTRDNAAPSRTESASQENAQSAAAPASGGQAGGNKLAWQRKQYEQAALDNGFQPEHLHQAADEVRSEDARAVADHNAMIDRAWSALEEFGVNRQNFRGHEDSSKVRGLDEVAHDMADHPDFASLFDKSHEDPTDTLFAMLKAGKRQPMRLPEVYDEALRILEATRGMNDEFKRHGQKPFTEEEIQAARELAEREQAEGEAGESALAAEAGHIGDVGDFGPDFGKPLTGAERKSPFGGQPDARDVTLRETALANAKVDQERQRRGDPPLMSAARLSNPEAWDRAMDMLAKDPEAGKRLVEEVNSGKKRALTVEESLLLLHRKIALRNELDRAVSNYIAGAREGHSAEQQVAADKLVENLSKQIDEAESAGRKAGTETGRALAIRRQLVKEDFSLGNLFRQAEKAKGKPLTEKEKLDIAALHDKIKELQERLDASETALAESKTGAHGPEFETWNRDMTKATEAKDQFAGLLAGYKRANLPLWEKIWNWFNDFHRAAVISSVKTLGKITGASQIRAAVTPVEEVAGSFWKQFPGVSKVFEKAPREGQGFTPGAEKAALNAIVMKGFVDAWHNLKDGKTPEDIKFGAKGPQEEQPGIGWLKYIGRSHGAAKATAVAAEYARSFFMLEQKARLAGEDVSSPAALYRLQAEAYIHSQRAKFQNENGVVDWFKNTIKKLLSSQGILPRAVGHSLETLFPVVRIPTNIAREVIQYGFGTIEGGLRTWRAFNQGIENLTAKEADVIARCFKKGSLGLVALGIGFFMPQVFGGYYTGRRREDELGVGQMQVGSARIPSWLLHNPLLEVFQFGATVRRAMDGTGGHRGQDFPSAFMGGLAGVAEQVPFAREAQEGIGLTSHNAGERGWRWGQFLRSMAVPQVSQWLAEQMDQGQHHRPQNVLQHIEMGIPGLRSQVPR